MKKHRCPACNNENLVLLGENVLRCYCCGEHGYSKYFEVEAEEDRTRAKFVIDPDAPTYREVYALRKQIKHLWELLMQQEEIHIPFPGNVEGICSNCHGSGEVEPHPPCCPSEVCSQCGGRGTMFHHINIPTLKFSW